MRHYEIVILIHPDQGDQVEAMVANYKNRVTEGGGACHRVENWGRRSMAYPIAGTHKAYYILMNIECNQSVLDQLKKDFRYNDAVIRDLCLVMQHAVTTPSTMAEEAEAGKADGQSDGKHQRRPAVNKRALADATTVGYKDLATIQRYIIDSGRILPSRITGVKAIFQRRLTKAVKLARFLALLPYSDAHRH